MFFHEFYWKALRIAKHYLLIALKQIIKKSYLNFCLAVCDQDKEASGGRGGDVMMVERLWACVNELKGRRLWGRRIDGEL